MSAASDKRDQIRQRAIGNRATRVLLVEGDDDKRAFDALLPRWCPQVAGMWTVEPAGKKGMVLELLKLEPTWLGLVDRDEWDQAEQQRRCTELPNLLVLPRFCLENYLIVPAELWAVLPTAQQAKVPGGWAAFEMGLLAELPRYLRHGVLWHIITPLWSGLRARGFKEKLASDSLACVQSVQSDADIQQVLNAWSSYLHPENLFREFQEKLAGAQAQSADQQLRDWVHGKTFWREAVLPLLKPWFGQRADSEWRKSIYSQILPPSDLQPLLARLQTP